MPKTHARWHTNTHSPQRSTSINSFTLIDNALLTIATCYTNILDAFCFSLVTLLLKKPKHKVRLEKRIFRKLETVLIYCTDLSLRAAVEASERPHAYVLGFPSPIDTQSSTALET